jgi:hypothetical protein
LLDGGSPGVGRLAAHAQAAHERGPPPHIT